MNALKFVLDQFKKPEANPEIKEEKPAKVKKLKKRKERK